MGRPPTITGSTMKRYVKKSIRLVDMIEPITYEVETTITPNKEMSETVPKAINSGVKLGLVLKRELREMEQIVLAQKTRHKKKLETVRSCIKAITAVLENASYALQISRTPHQKASIYEAMRNVRLNLEFIRNKLTDFI